MNYARRLPILVATTTVAVVVWAIFAMAVAPTDADEGIRQRLTYLHPAFAIATLMAFAISAWFAIKHLRHRRPIDDLRTYVAIHLGQIFCLISLLNGAIWGKAAWGQWWDWNEPLLVSFLLIFLLYATYQPLRFAIDDPEQQARVASVFALAAGIFTPACFGVVRLTTNFLHPQPLDQPATNLPGSVGITLAISMVAVLLLMVTLWHLEMVHKQNKIRAAKLIRAVDGPDAVAPAARTYSPSAL